MDQQEDPQEAELLRQLPGAAADGEVYVVPGTPEVRADRCAAFAI
jgi:hypothetical protein